MEAYWIIRIGGRLIRMADADAAAIMSIFCAGYLALMAILRWGR